jgi:hypothetical protein
MRLICIMRTRSGIESYIVRIYRRGGRESTDLAGIVEDSGTAEARPFRTREELIDILGGAITGPFQANDESGLRG